jgi:hypothetical protein
MAPTNDTGPSGGRKTLLLAAGLAVLALVGGLVVARLRAPPEALPPAFVAGSQVGDAKVTQVTAADAGMRVVELTTSSGRKVLVEVSRGAGAWSLSLVNTTGAPITQEDAQLVQALSEQLEQGDGGLAAALVAVPAHVPPVPDEGPYIPAGQEEQVAEMLGKGAELPGGCRWDGAMIERVTVLSRYVCGDENHSLRLCHPEWPCASQAAATPVFSIASDLPAPVLEALVTRIRAAEGAFKWLRPAVQDGGPPP